MSSFTELIERLRNTTELVAVRDLRAEQEAGADIKVIDVRDRDEFVDGHIEGSAFLPRGRLELQIENQVGKDERVVLLCAGGPRAILAAEAMKGLGYTNVAVLEGGFHAWKHAGFPVRLAAGLTPSQQVRYSRHLSIPEIGETGQTKLLKSRVLLIGAGGLGSPAAYYLAAAGVGTLGILDSDIVDRSNLQRQILHSDAKVGMPKVDSAELTLRALNPDVNIEKFNTRLNAENAFEIIGEGWDVVVDGGDNFPTRYLVNDVCVQLGIPNIHGSVYRFEGQATSFLPGGPCYRCLYPEPPPPELAPSCQEAGVLGVLPGIIGLLQSLEVIKVLVGVGETLSGRLLLFDGLQTTLRELKMHADPNCPSCGEAADTKFKDYQASCGASHS